MDESPWRFETFPSHINERVAKLVDALVIKSASCKFKMVIQ